MTIVIGGVSDESTFDLYRDARNGPRDRIRDGAYPSMVATMAAYNRLAIALAGGREATEGDDVTPGLDAIPDLSSFTEYHAEATAQVQPFIAMMYAQMQLVARTVELINQGARAQGIYPPFGERISARVIPSDYAALLSSTVQTIAEAGAALQQMMQANE